MNLCQALTQNLDLYEFGVFSFIRYRYLDQGVVWDIKSPVGSTILAGIFWFGWLFVLLSTFMINHFDLFGLRQGYINFKGQEYRHLDFKIIGVYKLCRHPIMPGFIIAFWAAPTMTARNLLFIVGQNHHLWGGRVTCGMRRLFRFRVSQAQVF